VKLIEFIYLPFAGLVMWPLVALAPAALFAALYAARRRASSLVATLTWGGYALYESLMKARVLCTGECNIRVDLVLIAPAVWVISIAAIVLFFRKKPDGAP
jgi:hypothetical protein